MSSNNPTEQPKEAPSFDVLNFSQSPTVEVFLQHLRDRQVEEALDKIASNQVRVLDLGRIEEYQLQNLRDADRIRLLETDLENHKQALQQVKQERDTLLQGVYHIYGTFSFVFKSIDGINEKKEAGKQDVFISKLLSMAGLKNVAPAAVSVIKSVINYLRNNMDSLTKNVTSLGDKLSPSLDILIKYEIIEKPKPAIESSTEQE